MLFSKFLVFPCVVVWLAALLPSAVGKPAPEPTPSVILITGCSTGIGKAAALKFAANDKYVVYATMRTLSDFKFYDPETLSLEEYEKKSDDEKELLKNQFMAKYPGLKLARLDVTQQADVDQVVADVVAEHGQCYCCCILSVLLSVLLRFLLPLLSTARPHRCASE